MATKAEIVRTIVAEMADAKRKDVIAVIIERAGMTPAGAATYYYNAKKALMSSTGPVVTEKPVKVAKPPKAKKSKTATAAVEEQVVAVEQTEAPKKMTKAELSRHAKKFLAWREKQSESELSDRYEFDEQTESYNSESTEAQELLRVIAD